MPDSINYQLIDDIVSAMRIGTYKKFFSEHSDQEIYGTYLWNKSMCSALYPLIQAAEICIRNAINNVAVIKYGDYWHRKIPALPYTDRNTGRTSEDANQKNLKKSFDQAEKTAIYKEKVRYKAKTGSFPKYQVTVDFNQIVAETDFKTWECALHSCFYDVRNKNSLWPHELQKAFLSWPVQSSAKTRIHIYDLVVELRLFRNRVFHHEPVWKSSKVTNEKEAIKFVRQKINKLESLIECVSPEKASFLRITGAFSKARRMASLESLDMCRYRSRSQVISLKRKNKIKNILRDCLRNDQACLINYTGSDFILSPK